MCKLLYLFKLPAQSQTDKEKPGLILESAFPVAPKSLPFYEFSVFCALSPIFAYYFAKSD